ncbi:type II secretion system protein D (GspD) [Desulfuromusa kysingii]|uniref:Type II secretion system protein D (GspD) n=1 Tax=Desulfuromusa kysingii TaxID=37625 RepID=A0A1H3W4D2_9BACT|nr:type II secretion system protein D (GspD) [Desulfuromusa kysingii]
MIRHGIKVLLPVCIFLLLLISQPLAAQQKQVAGELEVTLDFQNVELIDMIGTISELTGKNFVYDESVRGKVSIVSPRPVSVDEAYRLFSTVLRVKGFTIVPSGEVNKIISIRSAKEENLPISNGKNLGEQFITRIIELKNLDATVVVDTILRPLMPKTSHVVAYEPSNTIVMTDSAANIRRLAKILAELDRSWDGDRMEIVPLKFAEAEEIAEMVQQILENKAPASSSSRTTKTVGKKIGGEIMAYARTNRLMIVGDDNFIEQAKALIDRLDEKTERNESGIHVYYLEHAEAEGLAQILNQIIAGALKSNVQTNREGSTPKTSDNVSVTADKSTNALIVNASSKAYDGIKELIGKLDIKRKQVFVEALILEVSMDALLDLGVSLGGAIETGSDGVLAGSTNSDSGITSGGGYSSSLLSTAVDGIMLGGLFNPITTTINGESVTVPALSALINLSQTDSNVNVLSAPRLLTSDNEEAEIVVGQNVPVISSSSVDDNGDTSYSIERQDAALTLRFTPQITEGNMVRLEIYQEITAVTESVGELSEVGPTFTKRLVRNAIIAEDGKTVVLGGLFQSDVTRTETKIPLLGDIPFLGNLFKSSSDSEEKTSLLIFITPRVVRNSEDLEKITRENRANLEVFRTELGVEELFPPLQGGQLNEQPVEEIEE